MFKKSLIALAVTLANALPALAQPVSSGQDVVIPTPPVQTTDEAKRTLELSAGSQSLSAGYSDWRDVTLRGTYGLPRHILQGEVSLTRRFDETGAFVGVSDTYIFNEDWFGSLALGIGDGVFYMPRYRVDATVYKKWLANRSLVTSIGVGYYDAPDGHTDRSLSLGATYYFESPWILEGGVRMNKSQPGSVQTQQQFVAVTYGRNKQDLVTVRYGWGREGYQSIGANRQLVDFDSREASVAWRHWFDSRTGLLLSANRYTNPSYHRSGINVGVFYDF